MSGELQRGPDISVTFEVWELVNWDGGRVSDWHCIDKDFGTLAAAQDRLAQLPVVIPGCVISPGGRAQYRIRQAITILEWLE